LLLVSSTGKITVDDSGKNHYCSFLARSLLLVPGKIIVADSWQGHALTRTPFMIPARITVAGSWQDHRCWLLTRSQDKFDPIRQNFCR
jgi:hypothetical protein